MIISILAAALLVAQPASKPAPERYWAEAHEGEASAAEAADFKEMAKQLGIERPSNLTYLMCTSALPAVLPLARKWSCGVARLAVCVSEQQYNALGDANSLVSEHGYVGDKDLPPPSWFDAAKCRAGDRVVVRSLGEFPAIEGKKLAALKRVMDRRMAGKSKNHLAFSAVRITDSDKILLSVGSRFSGTEAQHLAAQRSSALACKKSPPGKECNRFRATIFKGSPDLVD